MATTKTSTQPKVHFTGAGCLLVSGIGIALLGFVSILGGGKSGGAVVLLTGLGLYIVGWFLARSEKRRSEQSASEDAVKRLLQIALNSGGRVSAAEAIAAGVTTSAGWVELVAALEKQGLGVVELDSSGLQVVVVKGLQTSNPASSSSGKGSSRVEPFPATTLPASTGLPAVTNPPSSQSSTIPSATGRSAVNSPSPTDRFVSIPVEPEYSLSAGIKFTVETPSTRFLAEARAMHAMEGTQAEHVPFMQYWPTYNSLVPSQLAWYMFWRSQVRQGVFLETDLSYIYLHVYEVLNLVETTDVQSAVDRLDALVGAYREMHPQLAWRLLDWSGDLLASKGQIENAVARWSSGQLVNLGNRGPVGNLVVHNYVVAHLLGDLPVAWWMELARYHPRNKFYAEYNDGGRIDVAYLRAALVADRHSRDLKGRSVVDLLTPPDIVRLKKPLFVSALVDEANPAEVDLGSVRDYFGSMRLSEHLTSVMRYAENLMRKQLGFGRKLSGVDIDPALAAKLDAEFSGTPAHSVPIRLDSEKIDQIRKATESVEALLRPVDEDSTAPTAGPGETKSPKVLYSDVEEVRQLWRLLSEEERNLVRIAFNGGNASGPDVLVNVINEKAAPLIGDGLLFVESGTLVIAEDYLDELEIILDEVENTGAVNGLPGDVIWSRLVGSLNDTELHLLHDAANDGVLDAAELADLSKTYRIMPHALLEIVNERACELMGMPLLYPEGDRWIVEEELLDALRNALASDDSSIGRK